MSSGIASLLAHAEQQRRLQQRDADSPSSTQQQQQQLPQHQLAASLPATPAATQLPASIPVVLNGSAIDSDDDDDVCLKGSTQPAPKRPSLSRSTSSSSSSRFAFSAVLAAKCDALGSLRWAMSASEQEQPLATAFLPRTRRAQERLAVTLSKSLWKSDADAKKCDTFACPTVFTLFERKHHCRKCGDIFCQACSSHTIELLDTTSLPFTHPPAEIIDDIIADPNAPFVPSRVCDDCWNQIHGLRTPATHFYRECTAVDSDNSLPRPRSVGVPSRRRTSGNESLEESLMLSTPPEGQPLPRVPSSGACSSSRNSRRRGPHSNRTSPVREGSVNGKVAAPSTPSSHRRRQTRMLLPHEIPIPREALEQKTPGGLLDDYPLKNPSAICKRMGGGIWKPKPIPVRLSSYGSVDEEEEDDSDEEDGKWKPNPIVKDGEIQTRVPQGPPPPKAHRPLYW